MHLQRKFRKTKQPLSIILQNEMQHNAVIQEGLAENSRVAEKSRLAEESGVAMIMVICVMALVAVLSAVLALSASTAMNNAHNESDAVRARTEAISLSKELERQLVSLDFDSQSAENSANDDSIWFYVKSKIKGGTWPYYNLSESGHGMASAQKTMHFDLSDFSNSVLNDAVGLREAQVVMYWQSDKNASSYNNIKLHIKVNIGGNSGAGGASGVGGSIAVVDSEYTLHCIETTDAITSQPYQVWRWSLTNRK